MIKNRDTIHNINKGNIMNNMITDQWDATKFLFFVLFLTNAQRYQKIQKHFVSFTEVI